MDRREDPDIVYMHRRVHAYVLRYTYTVPGVCAAVHRQRERHVDT
jgi:hypothetical protein